MNKQIEIKSAYESYVNVAKNIFIDYHDIENYLKEDFKEFDEIDFDDIWDSITSYLYDEKNNILFPNSTHIDDNIVNLDEIVNQFLHLIKFSTDSCCEKSRKLNHTYCCTCGNLLKYG